VNNFLESLWKRFAIAFRTVIRHLFPQYDTDSGFSRVWSWALLETVFFCAVALVLAFQLAPLDPFGLGAQFPWLWIIPAMLALRYGTAVGMIAVGIFLSSWLFLPVIGVEVIHQSLDSFPKVYFTGGTMLIVVCGQFADTGHAHIYRLRAINAYIDERLATLTKDHYLLCLSHDRLEQDLLARPLTLREALIELRKLSCLESSNALPAAQEFVQLLGHNCHLEVASLYVFDAAGNPAPQAVATLGKPLGLIMDDPLLQYSLERRVLAHVQLGNVPVDVRDESRYLISAPVITSQDELLGVLLVEKLPFFSLNDGALQQISVLAGFYADGVEMARVTHPVLQAVPDCPLELALDLVRLHRIKAHEGVDSTLVALVFEKDARSLDMYEQVKRLDHGGVDLSWRFSSERYNVALTLLTLANWVAVEGHLERIENAIQSQFGVDFVSGHVTVHVEAVGLSSPAETLKNLVSRCVV
jgi:hypothetical protein